LHPEPNISYGHPPIKLESIQRSKRSKVTLSKTISIQNYLDKSLTSTSSTSYNTVTHQAQLFIPACSLSDSELPSPPRLRP
jgi:hypothetical protein